MRKGSRILAFVLIFAMLFSLAACKEPKIYGDWYRKENEKANQDYLFGMCGIFHENTWDYSTFPWELGLELCNNLGVKSIRTWMRFSFVMTSDIKINENQAAKYHEHFAQQIELGIQTIGMCGETLLPDGTFGGQKPERDLSEGSVYMQWLEDYEECWYTLVSEFPEVEYWEIGNENNNKIEKIGGGMFNTKQMAEIFYDMLFFASRGIHRANPNAITVMGGIVPKGAPGFMQMMYDCIFEEGSWSPYPDDYFQVAAWHAYDDRVSEREITVNTWVADQQKIYDVIKQNEGKDKKVFITEYGWSETNIKQATIEKNLENVFTRVKKDLPFIEAMHYFRMFEAVNVWSGAALTAREFGLFNDPSAVFPNKENYVMGAPKPTAYTFQRLAGGSGDLTILQKD